MLLCPVPGWGDLWATLNILQRPFWGILWDVWFPILFGRSGRQEPLKWDGQALSHCVSAMWLSPPLISRSPSSAPLWPPQWSRKKALIPRGWQWQPGLVFWSFPQEPKSVLKKLWQYTEIFCWGFRPNQKSVFNIQRPCPGADFFLPASLLWPTLFKEMVHFFLLV